MTCQTIGYYSNIDYDCFFAIVAATNAAMQHV